MDEFNAKLGALGLFVPHGQCMHVHIGGHSHSGGYGQLTRSFGLFGDQIVEVEVITADGENMTASKEMNPDLFYAVLGGSPGNFAVLTHITLAPHRDVNHPNSRGMKFVCLYNETILKNLLEVMVDMANDEDFPGDFDYCVTMVSYSQQLVDCVPGLDTEMRIKNPEVYSADTRIQPSTILVFAQWANLEGMKQAYDPSFFNKIKAAVQTDSFIPPLFYFSLDDDKHMPMSKLTREWILHIVREFDLPYVKVSPNIL